jgi:hypothetical protein
VVDLLCTSVADIRSHIKSRAAFFFKVPAGLVACGAGSALYPTEYDLVTGISFLAMITVYTEVFGIIKGAFVIPVRHAVCLYLFRNGCGILA